MTSPPVVKVDPPYGGSPPMLMYVMAHYPGYTNLNFSAAVESFIRPLLYFIGDCPYKIK